ncbi:hypothetical protein HJ071_10055 [Vibrio parahaemolyticus]|nr:hypothetical protein [Vibrio parahaemolyticus]
MALTYDSQIENIGGNGFGGGSNSLLWFLLILFGLDKRGGFGGGDAGAGVLAGETQAKLDCLAQQHNALSQQIASNNQANQFQSIAQLIQAVGEQGRDGRFALNQQINDTRQQIADCCCETNRNIDDVKTQIAQQTSALLAAGTANTQRILDKLCEDSLALKDAEIRRLQDDLQTQTILAACNSKGPGQGNS